MRAGDREKQQRDKVEEREPEQEGKRWSNLERIKKREIRQRKGQR